MTTKQYPKRDQSQKHLAAVTLTAVAFGATFGGWALLAGGEQPNATAQAPTAAIRDVQIPLRTINGAAVPSTANAAAPGTITGSTPPSVSNSQITPPRRAPIARTRSSR